MFWVRVPDNPCIIHLFCFMNKSIVDNLNWSYIDGVMSTTYLGTTFSVKCDEYHDLNQSKAFLTSKCLELNESLLLRKKAEYESRNPTD